MANPFVKAWKYLMALFGAKVDEYADPKIQIQQAIEEEQRRHQGLTQQAAQVIVVFHDHDVQVGSHSSNLTWVSSGA